jgi:SAM-dependent methyltransferase
MKINYKHTKHIHNPTSANIILPFILNIVKANSVLDVGCGNGSWLKACKDLGVSKVFGVDGVNLPLDDLFITQKEFKVQDLTLPLELMESYDLVISLEVAEHLPEDSANTFVENLTNHGNVILFSAAIPEQGGQFHLNEQWPQYWNKLFNEKGFIAYDILRYKHWEDENILWWYQQNMILYVKEGDPRFRMFVPSKNLLPLVHPKLFRKKIFKPKFMNSKKEIFNAVLNGMKYLIKGN